MVSRRASGGVRCVAGMEASAPDEKKNYVPARTGLEAALCPDKDCC